MHLILWRHAEAADGFPDVKRELTPTGHQQARNMATWLRTRLPGNVRVIASPAERAKQTASALTRNFEIVQEIAPAASCNEVLSASGWPHADGTVVLVGHQPTLGAVASTLLTGRALQWNVNKGAIWWFRARVWEEHVETSLRAVISPGLLTKGQA